MVIGLAEGRVATAALESPSSVIVVKLGSEFVFVGLRSCISLEGDDIRDFEGEEMLRDGIEETPEMPFMSGSLFDLPFDFFFFRTGAAFRGDISKGPNTKSSESIKKSKKRVNGCKWTKERSGRKKHKNGIVNAESERAAERETERTPEATRISLFEMTNLPTTKAKVPTQIFNSMNIGIEFNQNTKKSKATGMHQDWF